MQKNESSAKNAKEIVMGFIQALERKDFKTVRSYISDNISVVAPGPVELTTFNRAIHDLSGTREPTQIRDQERVRR